MTTHKKISRDSLEKQEKAFNLVRNEFLNSELEKKVARQGQCEYIFERLGDTQFHATSRQCEREKGHTGAHMFGVYKV